MAQNEGARQAQVEKMVTNAPETVQGSLRRAFTGSASPRSAIKAQCLVCVGFVRSDITNCTGWSCPLWKYRPFQAKSAAKAT